MTSFSNLEEYLDYTGYVLVVETKRGNMIPCDIYFGFKNIKKQEFIINCTALPYNDNIDWYSLSKQSLVKDLHRISFGNKYLSEHIKNFHPISEKLFKRLNMMVNVEEIRRIKKMFL